MNLQWSEHQPPSDECSYNHVTAETPFGRFLITWKGWKESDCPTVDETPWGGWWEAFATVEDAKQACADEYLKRLSVASTDAPIVPEGYALVPLDATEHTELLDRAMDNLFDWRGYADRAEISEAAMAVAYAARDLAAQQQPEQKEESSPKNPVNEESLIRDDPLNTDDCTHPDCGRFYDHNAGRMSCRAMPDNACARPGSEKD